MEHGSIITQARREDALVLTKQGRGATSQNFASPPGGEGAGESGETPGSVGPGAPVGTPTPAGAERGPELPAPSGRVSSAQLSPDGPPLPPGARIAPGHPRLPHRSRGDGVVTSPPPTPPQLRACPGAARRGTKGPRLERPRDRSSHAGPRSRGRPGVRPWRRAGLGTKFTDPRRGRRWGRGRATTTAGRRTLAVPRSKQVRPGAPPCPVRSPGAAAAHTAAFV